MKRKISSLDWSLLILIALFAASFIAFDFDCRSQINKMTVDLNDTMSIVTQLENENQQLKEDNSVLQDKVDQLQQQLDDVQQSRTSSSINDEQYIKSVVMAEARGSTLQDQMAVLQTIVDRSSQSGLSMYQVVIQPYQYAKPYHGPISDSVNEAYQRVVVNGERVFPYPTTHFYADYIDQPYWADQKTCRGKVNRHIYFGD